MKPQPTPDVLPTICMLPTKWSTRAGRTYSLNHTERSQSARVTSSLFVLVNTVRAGSLPRRITAPWNGLKSDPWVWWAWNRATISRSKPTSVASTIPPLSPSPYPRSWTAAPIAQPSSSRSRSTR
jgi:hypothetical protein